MISRLACQATLLALVLARGLSEPTPLYTSQGTYDHDLGNNPLSTPIYSTDFRLDLVTAWANTGGQISPSSASPSEAKPTEVILTVPSSSGPKTLKAEVVYAGPWNEAQPGITWVTGRVPPAPAEPANGQDRLFNIIVNADKGIEGKWLLLYYNGTCLSQKDYLRNAALQFAIACFSCCMFALQGPRDRVSCTFD